MTINSFSSRFNLLVFSAIILVGISCQRDVDGGTGWDDGTDTGSDNVMVTAGVRGVVIDENNQPVAGATVTSGSYTTVTDRYGVFRLNNIRLSRENGWVRITKAGYFNGYRSFLTTAGRIHNVRIRLLPRSISGTFSAGTGGTVTLSNGAKVIFPSAAILDGSGNTYNGQVNIAMTWINPTAANLPEIVPGDLRGLTTTGEERGLQTFGMIGVEMTGPGGESLKLAAGKTAELNFPIPASMTSPAPSTIDLWYFDETTARWKQEGTATKTGNNYIANVSHFSFWNCDAPFPLVEVCMTLVNASGSQPLVNVQVRIVRNDGGYASGWTDSTGKLCGKVPKSEALVLQLMDQCNNPVYTQNIGPFNSNTDLGNIQVSIPPANALTITGRLVNCSGGNVTNGAVSIQTNGAYNYPLRVTNGNFSITILRCGSTPVNFNVIGVDYTSSLYSLTVSGAGTSGTVNVGNVQACGAADEYMEFVIDGTPYSIVEFPPNEVETGDSSGTGGYLKKTYIGGYVVTNNNVEACQFWFLNNQVPGVYPIDRTPYFRIELAYTITLLTIVTPNPTVTITRFDPPGGYIEGHYNIVCSNSVVTPNVICHFRVKRD